MWNLFKKPAATPQDNPVVAAATLLEGTPRLMLMGSSRTHEQLPRNDELLAALQSTPRTAGSDWSGIWPALLEAQLWVPVYDADLETAESRQVHGMVFQQETAFYAFTSAEHARAFFANNIPVEGDTLNVALVDGRTACDMATHFEVGKLLLNPNFAEELELLPLAFRVLARNFVPGRAGAPIPRGDADFLLPVGGLPPEPALNALREVLSRNGASAAYWLINFWERPGDYAEMRYTLGVECSTEQFLGLEGQLAHIWQQTAPFPTPLLCLPISELGDVAAFVRERCAQLYP